MWVDDALKPIVSEMMYAAIRLKPPFDVLAETVTNRHLASEANEVGVSLEAARYLLIEDTGLLVRSDLSLEEQAGKLNLNDLLRSFNLKHQVFTAEEPLVGIGDLPTVDEVLARYGAVFSDIERHVEAGKFAYLATFAGTSVSIGVETYGTHSKLSTVSCSLRFWSTKKGDDLGILMLSGILGDWGPNNRSSTREYTDQIWHGLWLGQLAATYLKEVLD